MKAADEPPSQSRVARRILAYLEENPRAQDSLEGIFRWWLLDRHLEEQIRVVEAGLAELVAAGLVEEVRGPDRQLSYRLNRRRAGAVRTVMKRNEREAERGNGKPR